MRTTYQIGWTFFAAVFGVALTLGILTFPTAAFADPGAVGSANCTGCVTGIQEGDDCGGVSKACDAPSQTSLCPTCVCQPTTGGDRKCY